MLNIFNLKLNNNNKHTLVINNNLTKSNQIQHFSPTIKEWNSSIYSFNKNNLNLIPICNKIVSKLIKSYFNLYNNQLESKIKRQEIRMKLRRLSSHRIYISKEEFKHTNDKVIINIFVYNRQKYNYLYKIRKILNVILKNKRIKIIKEKIHLLIEETTIINSKIKLINNIKFKYYQYMYIKILIEKYLKKELLYIYYKRLFIFNKLKFKYTYLNKIKNLIEKVYNKNVEFNIINLKYYYLNSDILTESIITKITKDRKKLYKILKTSIQKIKIIDRKWIQNSENINILYKLIINNFVKKNKIKSYLSIWTKNTDTINELMINIFPVKKNKHLKKTVLNNIKNKTVTGVRIEVAGRLSKRHTASRSLFKLRYKGSLKNINSTYKGLSSKLLRGDIKSNIQYTKLNSVARIGSFGIKGWISNN